MGLPGGSPVGGLGVRTGTPAAAATAAIGAVTVEVELLKNLLMLL